MYHFNIKSLFLAFIIFSVSLSASPSPYDDAYAYWNFNESNGSTVYDSAGNNHGTLINSPTRSEGMHGNGLEFPGLDSISCPYVSIPEISFSANEAWSFSMWQKTADSSWNGFIGGNLKTSDSSPETGYWMWHYSHLTAYLRSPYPVYFYGVSAGIQTPIDEWFHLTVTTTPTTSAEVNIKVYIDGSLIQSLDMALENNKFSFIYIGKGDGSRNFDGTLDDVAIWDKALNASEIAAISNPIIPELSNIFLIGLAGFLLLKLRQKHD